MEIDHEAGPSEVVVLADESADAGWVAADLLAQAEHGSGEETVVLVTPVAAPGAGGGPAGRRGAALRGQPRDRRAGALRRHGAMVLVRDLEEGVAAVNALAPEHAEVMTRRAAAVARGIVAGAVFVGGDSPGGGGRLRHRPQPRAAHRRAPPATRSPLSVRDFQRRQQPGAPQPRRPAPRGARAWCASRWPRASPATRRASSPGSRHDRERSPPHVKPAVRALRAYTLAARQAPVKINQNENPYDLPEALKRRVLEQALARPWSRYPDFDPQELLEALAAFPGWRADGILAGNGSNELIEALLLVTVGPGTRVVIPEPTFTLYALLTGVLGGEAVRVPLGPDLEYDAAR